jgi:hypothetical protein
MAQQCGHLLRFEIVSGRQWRALHRNQCDLLAGREHLRHAQGEIGKKGVEGSPALIARARMIAAVLLQVLEERQHPIEGQILNRQPSDRSPRLLRDKAQEQPHGIAVAADGAQAQTLLYRQVVGKKRLYQLTEGGCHGRSPSVSVGAAKASKRRLASFRSVAVIVKYTAVELTST